MLARIRAIYDLYGFDPLETPMIEYTEALGKFLPDSDRPNEGVFSLQDDDEQWMSLRYDLTAPLARHVAEHFDKLPKPYRSYRSGWVFRNEKPGPDRFRQFMQFDADTVGAPTVAADAEMCMMAAHIMQAVGLEIGDYIIRVNNRKVLDGVMEITGLSGEAHIATRLAVLRAIDKLDRLGRTGVCDLLGEGRLDGSGDFTKGAGLSTEQVEIILAFLDSGKENTTQTIAALRELVASSLIGIEGVDELADIGELIATAGFDDGRIVIDPSVVRGLEYYTGPVYEAELTFKITNDDGEIIRFGSVGGGGRYDGLIGRFRSEGVPATGFSIGVSRLAAALHLKKQSADNSIAAPVVVLVMDRGRFVDYQAMAQQLRNAGIRAEVYMGSSGMKAQMKYADRRGAPCVIIQGSDEKSQNLVQIKDLLEGKKLSAAIDDNETWRTSRPAQFSVPEAALVENVATLLARQAEEKEA